jgi:uncharacterized membrane protein YeaQ/YmgE (transglycosylase-associated protein family)
VGPYVWCVIGVVMGWLATVVGRQGDFIVRVESVLVGVFGAFVGGEFLASMLLQPAPKGAGLTAGPVLFAVAGALVGLLLLHIMRRAVGPLKAGKKRSRSA